MNENNPLFEPQAKKKIYLLKSFIHQNLCKAQIPLLPARDLIILPVSQLPAKVGLSSHQGQARLIHDLASIELQAMELALRTLLEFPEAPEDFKEELKLIAISESEHLTMCLRALEELGHPWGTWPAHLALWQTVDKEDHLLDRVLIVHRYLEGSGLDAGLRMMKRLKEVKPSITHEVVKRILNDEIDHVSFGSAWYQRLCDLYKLNSNQDFKERLFKLKHRLPRRLEKIDQELRLKAGFSMQEIESLRSLQNS